MLYFIKVKCQHCRCECPWGVEAEAEPPPDARITIECPNHGGPIPVPFRYFKPVESLPPNTPVDSYPPDEPRSPARWWQFWKR